MHKGMVSTRTHTVVTSILVTTTASRVITTRAPTMANIKTTMFRVTLRSLRTTASITTSEKSNSFSLTRRIKALLATSPDQGVTLSSEAGTITLARITNKRKRARVKTKNQKRSTSSLRSIFSKARKKSSRKKTVEITLSRLILSRSRQSTSHLLVLRSHL